MDERARRLFDAAIAELAAQYDPERNLVRHETDVDLYYTPRGGLTYARCLLLGGDDRRVSEGRETWLSSSALTAVEMSRTLPQCA